MVLDDEVRYKSIISFHTRYFPLETQVVQHKPLGVLYVPVLFSSSNSKDCADLRFLLFYVGL